MRQLFGTFTKVVPTAITPRNGQIPQPVPNTINSNEWVLRITTTVQSTCAIATAPIPSQNINLDISFTDDCAVLTPTRTSGSLPELDRSSHVQHFSSVISTFKSRTLGALTDASQFSHPQTPYFLAYLYGQLLAYEDRIALYPWPGQRPLLSDALFGFGLAANARPPTAAMNHSKFTSGPLVIPAANPNSIGPFPYHQIQANQTLDFPTGVCLFLQPEHVNSQDCLDFLWLLWAMHSRNTPNFQNSWTLSLNVYSTVPAPGRQAPVAGTITQARLRLALDFGYRLLYSMFNEQDDLLHYYTRKGIETMFRPCSFYTEGGLIRKAARYVSMAPPSGFYSMRPAQTFAVQPIHHAPHPGLAAALETFVDVMTLQTVLSFTGPKMVQQTNQADDLNLRNSVGEAVAPDDVVFYNPHARAPPLSFLYYRILTRHDENLILNTALSQLYENYAPIVYANIMNSVANCRTRVINNKLQKSFVKRPQGAPPLKYNTAFINRFHDPELAYLLGICSDGILPLQGPHTFDLLQEATYLFSGGDLRNCPGLNALNNRGLDSYLIVTPDHRSKTRGYYTTLDGQIHSVPTHRKLSQVYTWKDRGSVTKPYACHILESFNLEILSVSPEPVKGMVFNTVTSPLATPYSYMGPSFGLVRLSEGPVPSA